jgi:hypothetical protein
MVPEDLTFCKRATSVHVQSITDNGVRVLVRGWVRVVSMMAKEFPAPSCWATLTATITIIDGDTMNQYFINLIIATIYMTVGPIGFVALTSYLIFLPIMIDTMKHRNPKALRYLSHIPGVSIFLVQFIGTFLYMAITHPKSSLFIYLVITVTSIITTLLAALSILLKRINNIPNHRNARNKKYHHYNNIHKFQSTHYCRNKKYGESEIKQ